MPDRLTAGSRAAQAVSLDLRPHALPEAERGRLPTSLRRLLPVGWRSVRVTVLGTLALLLLLTGAAALITRHQLSYRVHDYAILNLAGQMREMAGAMSFDAAQLRRVEAGELADREIADYRQRLTRMAAQFDRIVASFEGRTLPPELTGLDQPVNCSWDEPSLRQLAATARTWKALHQSIAPGLQAGSSESAVLAAAAGVAREGGAVLESSRQLSHAFKAMMQRKLDAVLALQLGVLAVTVVLGMLLVAWMQHRVLRPLRAVERGALRLVDGDLHARVPEHGDREIVAVADGLNRLSARLRLLFDVAERTNAGLNTGELLDTLREALQPVVPVDLLGVVVRMADDPDGWRIHRTSGLATGRLADGACLSPGADGDGVAGLLGAIAADQGLESVLVVPLRDTAHESAVLVFAARAPDAWTEPALALLRVVADPVRGQIDRTLSTEALVVSAVEGLAKLAESRDPETGDHLVRISAYSAMIATEMASDPRHAGLIDARYVDDLRRFAPMHDIGKVGIADSILLKPGRLTEEERVEMSRHPSIGADVLRRCEAQMQARGRTVFRVGIEIAEGHHEKWDGSGYPNGLAGEAIPLSARIVAVADVFDALTSKRPYKEAWPVERALATITADSGGHFDPAVVDALHRRLPEILAFYERHKHV